MPLRASKVDVSDLISESSPLSLLPSKNYVTAYVLVNGMHWLGTLQNDYVLSTTTCI